MSQELTAAMNELGESWYEIETHDADFSDARLNKRFTQVLGQMSRMPQSPLNQSAEDLSEMLGAYRFIDNKKVTIEKILAPHKEQISRRAEAEKTVLLIQDTSYLDMNDHFKCDDLKPLRIRHLQRALWAHATLCMTTEGLPLGIADAQFMTGKVTGVDEEVCRQTLPIQDKQTRRWLNSVKNCRNIFSDQTQKIWLCDREADIYEFLEEVVQSGDNYIVRSRFDRATEDAPFYDLRHQLKHSSISGHYEVNIPGKGTRKARTAKMELRFISVNLSVPEYRKNFVNQTQLPQSSVIEVIEIDPPSGEEPLHWKLLTNLKVESFEDALQVVKLYQKRWGIEEIFKILKSGCRVEKAQFQNTTRMHKYLTLSLIVSWRIYFLVHVNRIQPEAPAEAILTTSELDTLQLLLDDKRARKNERKMVIKTAKQAITQIAILGGYLNRKNDPNPGTTVLWRGMMALAFSTMTFLARQRVVNL